MSKVHKSQSGFSVVAIILALMVIGLIGAAGFLVYSRHNGADTAMNSSSASKYDKKQTKDNVQNIQSINSYNDCIKVKDSVTSLKSYPPTCTSSENVIYRPTDPDNFLRGQQQMNIPNNPNVTTDSKVAEQDGYCFNNEVPGPQATATLDKMVDTHALVTVSPNCGDTFELTYNKVNGNWTVINTSHLGLCFQSKNNANESLQSAISKLCN